MKNFNISKLTINLIIFLIFTKNYIFSNQTQNFDIKYCKIDLNATDTSIAIDGSVMYLIEINKCKEIIFELSNGYKVDSITVENIRINFQHYNDSLKINLPAQEKKLINLEIFYKIIDTKKINKGIFNKYVYHSNKNYTYTISEPFALKFWLPCKQDLNDKIDSVDISITVDKGLKAISNGILTDIQEINNKTKYTWKTRYPIAYYLICMNIGDYYEYNFYWKYNEKDSMLVQNFFYKVDSNQLNEIKKISLNTINHLNTFSSLFGLYPFYKEKYGLCLVPFSGGMEHQTITSIGIMDENIMVHELAHQWFGDYVTCKSWQDIWINEGFATYCEYLYIEKTNKDLCKNWLEYTANNAIDSGSVYVPSNESINENRIFNYFLSYKKGGFILHMLRNEIDDDSVFFNVLKNFLNHFAFKNASGEDFKTILENITGKDYTYFFNQWYYDTGFPAFNIMWWQRNDTLYIRSFQVPIYTNICFKVPLEFKINFSNRDTILKFYQHSFIEDFVLPINDKVFSIEFDPDIKLLKKVLNIVEIKDADAKRYLIYPNLTKGIINISALETTTNEFDLFIYSQEGRLLKKLKVKNKTTTVNIENFKNGIYLFVISDDKGFFVRKITKR